MFSRSSMYLFLIYEMSIDKFYWLIPLVEFMWQTESQNFVHEYTTAAPPDSLKGNFFAIPALKAIDLGIIRSVQLDGEDEICHSEKS